MIMKYIGWQKEWQIQEKSCLLRSRENGNIVADKHSIGGVAGKAITQH